MLRLLIADRDGSVGEAIQKQLSGEYIVELCKDGGRVLELAAEFDPDMILLDLRLPGMDGLSVLELLRSSGRTARVFAMSDYWSEYLLTALEKLEVCGVFTVPCTVDCLIAGIREAGFRIRYPEDTDWCVELEADRILLSLGFRMGRSKYTCVYEAICVKCADFNMAITKEVYPAVVNKMGGNEKQMEKAIRDTIHAAFAGGDPRVWRLYFVPGQDGQLHCPTNDEFITRIARALLQRSRFRVPYQPLLEQAQ